MAWFRRAKTAATAPMDARSARLQVRLRQPWQARASFFAQNLGLVSFASRLIADSISRFEPIPERQVPGRPDEWEPVTDPIASDVIGLYRGRHQSMRELVADHAWLYETVGEMAAVVELDNGRPIWGLYSPLAATWQQNGVLIREVEGGGLGDGGARLLPLNQVTRVWNPNKTWKALATSPLQGVMADCERYWSLARRIRREADSALAMNGLLWTPKEAHTWKASQQIGPGGTAISTSALEADYVELSKRAMEDDDSVAAVVPPMLNWSHTYGPPTWIPMGRPLDPNGIAYRMECVEAIGRGLDFPQRLLVQGLGDANHWSDWLVVADFARTALAPKGERIFWGDLTTMYFRPALRALQARGLWEGDPERMRMGFDMSPVIVHPDQTKTALELYREGVLSDVALLEISGIDVAALSEKDELARWIFRTRTQRETIRVTEQAPTLTVSPLEPGGAPDGASGGGSGEAPAGMAALTNGHRELVGAARYAPFPSEAEGWLRD